MNSNIEMDPFFETFFKQESGQLVSGLIRRFGVQYFDFIEDAVQDTHLDAIKIWSEQGIPRNPKGWFFVSAKNKLLNCLKRENFLIKNEEEILHDVKNLSYGTYGKSEAAGINEYRAVDSQLRLMFICCHPAISIDSQIALTLKTLCGFSIPEIAKAYFTSEESIQKRLVRARQTIKSRKLAFELPAYSDLSERLDAVLAAIYFLFNEGYNASAGEDLIRYELCAEAIRLAKLIKNHAEFTNHTNVYALLSLMQLNASRFNSRLDGDGNLLTLREQNRSLWDSKLISQGMENLSLSANSDRVSKYHLLAGISAFHCMAQSYEDTNWKGILSLYDKLLHLDNSPIVHLNRSIAVAEVNGPALALENLKTIENDLSMEKYYLFYSTQAQFFKEMGNMESAIKALKKAIFLAPLEKERAYLLKCLQKCQVSK